MTACPCGGESFDACCGPALAGLRPAPTAEALMRSRYTAFTRGDIAYLQSTQLAPFRDSSWPETERWAKSVHWLSLQVVATERGLEADSAGEVEFVARYLESGQVHALRERSGFVRQNERWCYASGKPELTSTDIERNSPCPCGSGRKFKQCHA